MNDLADLETTDAGDGLVVARIRGDLDLSNLYSVHTALLEMLPNEAIGLVVDLGGVTFLDSSGVEALFRLQTSLEVRQQHLAVAIPAGATIRRALELSGAQGEMPLCGSVDEALAVLRAGPEHGAQETG
jgi:anti-sigma B factor antagonist